MLTACNLLICSFFIAGTVYTVYIVAKHPIDVDVKCEAKHKSRLGENKRVMTSGRM